MSNFGLEVLTGNGAKRVFDGTWFFKYFDTYNVYAGPDNEEVKISIPGFNPSTWGIHLVNLEAENGDIHHTVLRKIRKEMNALYVRGSNFTGLYYTIKVYKGD